MNVFSQKIELPLYLHALGSERVKTIILSAFFLLEAAIFFTHAAVTVAPYYSPAYDQLQYLTSAYRLVQTFYDDGIAAVLRILIKPYQPNGILLPFQAAALIALTGLPRLGALAVNLFVFIALQVAVFFTFSQMARSAAIGWLSLGLVLSLKGLTAVAGGIYDFRIDFFALCVFGMWSCAVINSGVFAERRWSIISGIIGAWLLCTRFISIVYLGPIMSFIFLGALLEWWRRGTSTRIRNTIIAGAIIVGCSLPFLWINRQLLYDYYFVSHFISQEREWRAREYGIDGVAGHLFFYPRSILAEHLGMLWLFVTGALLLIMVVLRSLLGTTRHAGAFFYAHRVQLGFLTLAIILPLALLNSSTHKSPVIGGILVIPVLCLVGIFISALAPDQIIRGRPTAAILFAVLGLLVFMLRIAAPKPPINNVDNEAINRLNDETIEYVVRSGIASPAVSVDRACDYFNWGTLVVRYYERFSGYRNFLSSFGGGPSIGGLTLDDIITKLDSSDIILLTDPMIGRDLPYPINTEIKPIWHNIARWTAENRILLVSENVYGVPNRVFVRPWLRVFGASGNWITSAGITIEVNTTQIARWPYVVLEGAANYEWLGGVPAATAEEVDITGTAISKLPVSFDAVSNGYRLMIDAHSLANQVSEVKAIRVYFDRYFVPKELKINEDTRKLVIWSPTKTGLRASFRDIRN